MLAWLWTYIGYRRVIGEQIDRLLTLWRFLSLSVSFATVPVFVSSPLHVSYFLFKFLFFDLLNFAALLFLPLTFLFHTIYYFSLLSALSEACFLVPLIALWVVLHFVSSDHKESDFSNSKRYECNQSMQIWFEHLFKAPLVCLQFIYCPKQMM